MLAHIITGLNIKHLLIVFNSWMKSIIDDASPTLLLASQIALENLIIVQIKIIKSALGLLQATHNVIVYAEANTFPQSTICEINTIKTIDRCAIFDNPTPI